MNGHTAIHDRLTAFAGLIALVPAARITPDIMPDNPTFPAITYHMISESSARGSTSDPAMMRAIFQVTSWSRSSRLEAQQVADQVRKALDRYRAVTVNSIKIDDCFFENNVDLYEPETKTFYVATTFRLHYRES